MRIVRIAAILAALFVLVAFGLHIAGAYLSPVLSHAQEYPHVGNILVLVAGLVLIALAHEIHVGGRLTRDATFRFVFFQALVLFGFRMMNSPFDMQPLANCVVQWVPLAAPYLSGILAILMVLALLGVAISIVAMAITLLAMLMPQVKPR